MNITKEMLQKRRQELAELSERAYAQHQQAIGHLREIDTMLATLNVPDEVPPSIPAATAPTKRRASRKPRKVVESKP
jgi:DNA-binding protein H-NS